MSNFVAKIKNSMVPVMSHGRKKYLILFCIALATVTFLLPSCDKSDSDAEPSSSLAIRQAIACRLLNDVVNISEELLLTGIYTESCATVTFDMQAEKDTIVVDFGAADCLCSDGHSRRGVLKISFPAMNADSLVCYSISASQFAMNGYRMDGIILNMVNGYNNIDQYTYTVTFSGNITMPDDSSFQWQASFVRIWKGGITTADFSDNIYQFTGSAEGTADNGSSWSSFIIIPLEYADSCTTGYPVRGADELCIAGTSFLVMKYGDGVCGYDFSLISDGSSWNFTLP
jgi:hypothetical protein